MSVEAHEIEGDLAVQGIDISIGHRQNRYDGSDADTPAPNPGREGGRCARAVAIAIAGLVGRSDFKLISTICTTRVVYIAPCLVSAVTGCVLYRKRFIRVGSA